MSKKYLWVLVTIIAVSIAVRANLSVSDQFKNGQLTAARSTGQNVETKILGTISERLPEVSSMFPILSLVAAIGVDRFLRYRKKNLTDLPRRDGCWGGKRGRQSL